MRLLKKLIYQAMVFLLALAIVSPSLFDLSLHSHQDKAHQNIEAEIVGTSCQDHSCYQNDEETESLYPERNLAHEQDCHCPGHRSHCGHPLTYITAQESSLFSLPLFVCSLFEVDYSVKAGPILDSPYQPPRA